MIPQTRLIFNRRHTASKTSLAAVEIEVTYQSHQKRMSTGVHVYINQWDARRLKVCNRDDMEKLNEIISIQFERVNNAIIEILKSNEAFSFEILDDRLNRKIPKTFIEFCQDQLASRTDLTERTIRQHLSWIEVFKKQKFIKYFSDITPANIKLYDKWLHDGKAQSTIWAHHKVLRVYIHNAILLGIIDRDPYLGFKVNRGNSQTINYLVDEEVMKIRSLELEGDFDIIRDLFIVQCYTGLAYADLMKTDWHDVTEKDGHYLIVDQRRKTKETYHILLLKPVVEILRKYDFDLPKVANYKYNELLKCIQVMAGISTKLTTHVGRHTFAVMMINKDVPIEIVAKMMGHSSTKTTQIYAEILGKSVHEAYLNIDKMIQ